MKIVMLDAITVSNGDISLNSLCKFGDVEFFDSTSENEIVERVGNADAVICNKTVMSADVLKSCKNLKYIGECATGYNNIDIKTAKELGIVVSNVPGYSTDAVAQQVFSFILYFASKTNVYNDFVHNGGWISSRSFTCFDYPLTELAGHTIGIIGYGSIGKAVAKIARAFNMNVIVNTRTVRPDSTVEFVNLETLFEKSDIITVHCPLTEKTNGLINSSLLNKCKKSAIIINTSRGPVVNENDLADALNNEIIAGAGLDVLCHEPMLKDNPLLTAKNCIITPHISWAPLQTRKRLMKVVEDNLKAFIDGKPVNVVE